MDVDALNIIQSDFMSPFKEELYLQNKKEIVRNPVALKTRALQHLSQ